MTATEDEPDSRLLATSGTRVVIVGSGTHTAGSRLPDVPVVEETVRALAHCLVTRCGLPETGLRLVLDPEDPTTLDAAIRQGAREAEDVFVLCYIGHGVLSPSGELHLATRATVDVSRGRAASQALEFTAVTDAITLCRAGTVLVVLDCCFSGRATPHQVNDSLLLTSATGETAALAPEGLPHTLFTGELVRLLTDGDPHSPPQLTLGQVAAVLRRRLRGRGSTPVARFSGAAAGLVLTANCAYQPPEAQPGHDQGDEPGSITEDVCPYRGLAAFEAEDARFFFGRNALVQELVRAAAVRSHSGIPLLLVGASGAGKSSLLQAGFLPAVRRGELPGAGAWRWLSLTPGGDPLGALATELAAAVGWQVSAVRAQLTTSPEDVVRQSSSQPVRLALIVDQFEELFTQCADEREQEVFVQALCALASAATGRAEEPPALVVLSARSDFLGHCTRFSCLIPAVRDAVIVGPMTGGQVRSAIVGPARTVGLDVDTGLVEVLLRDLGADATADGSAIRDAGSLPHLSHALLATWQRRSGRLLTVADYRSSGGIDGAIASTAETIHGQLDDRGRAELRRVLLALVNVGDGVDVTRRKVHRDDLFVNDATADTTQEVLAALVAERLVTTDADTVEITHEALLRAWPRLRTWVDANRSGLVIHRELSQQTRSWHLENKHTSRLYQGPRLAAATEWARNALLTKEEQAFLDASVRHERRRRLQRQVIAMVLLVAVVAGWYAFDQRSRAETRAREAAARELVVTADTLRDREPRTSLMLYLAAHRLDPNLLTRTNLVDAVVSTPYGGTVRMPTARTRDDSPIYDDVVATAISPDGRTVATGSENGVVTLWPVDGRRLGKKSLASFGSAVGVSDLRFSQDGHTLTVVGFGVAWWNVADRPHPRLLPGAIGNRYVGSLELVADEHISEPALLSHDQRLVVLPLWSTQALGQTTLWDITDAQHPVRLATLGNRRPFAFSPDGHTLVTREEQGSDVILWDVQDPSHPVEAVRWWPWDPYASNDSIYLPVVFSPDGAYLALAGIGETVRLWNISDRRHPTLLSSIVAPFDFLGVRALAFHPDGHTLVTGSGRGVAALWDVVDPRHPTPSTTLGNTAEDVSALAYSPDGGTLVVGTDNSGLDNGTATLWNLTDARALAPVGSTTTRFGAEGSVAFTPDSDVLLTSNSAGTASLWDLTTPERPTETVLHDSKARPRADVGVAVTANGALAAVRDDSGRTVLWDITDRAHPTQLTTLTGPPGDTMVVFSPDGHLLAVTNSDGVALWDVTDRRDPSCVAWCASEIGDRSTLAAVGFTSDSRTLAATTSGAATNITLWDVTDPTNPIRKSALVEMSAVVNAVEFTADDRVLSVTASGFELEVGLWDVSNLSRPKQLSIFSENITVATDISRNMLATGGWDNLVHLWAIDDPAEPVEITALGGHAFPVTAVAFAPNGQLLATRSMDGELKLWNVADLLHITTDPEAAVCALADPGLAPDQWEKYIPQFAQEQLCP